MSQRVTTPTKSFDTAAAIGQYLRVKHSSAGVIAVAGASEESIGVTTEAKFEAGKPIAILLRTAEGTRKMVASGAISAGAKVFGAAGGKISASGSVFEGVALEAATADGDVIEVLDTRSDPTANGGTANAVAATGSTQSDAAALILGMNTVSAADGTKGVVLPTAVAGLKVQIYNEHATNGLKVYPNTSDDINDGTVNTAITMEGKTLATFQALDATTWAAQYTANA
jgi:hypothetical protein